MWERRWSRSATRSAWPTACPPAWSPASTGPRRLPTGTYSGLIQFDASVNPGSSGGALLDARGLVIGIVVSIANPAHEDAFAGIGFAVPIGAALGGGSGTGPGHGPQI